MERYASKVLAVAKAEVGYLEKKSNSSLDSKTANAGYNNYTKYARDLDKLGYFYNGPKNGYPYCDVFVDWCFVQAYGVDAALDLLCQPKKSYGAGCEFSARYYKQKGQFHKKNPKAGDQIFFWNSKKTEAGHTGLVRKVDSTYVYTYEGNTSGASGVIANGGGVCSKKYKLNDARIYGYGRPNYDKEPSNAETPKKEEPKKSIKLEVTGLWDKATTTRLQQIFGTPVDGIVSNQWAAYKHKNPGLTSGWDWHEKPNGKGSALIKAMQKWAGMATKNRDGEFGPATCRAIQKKLGTFVDGYVSNPSAMVKALQRWANAQEK